MGKIFKKSYIYLILILFYIPLLIGAIYSFSEGKEKGNMSSKFKLSGEGWSQLVNDSDISYAILNTTFIAIFVALIVVTLSLLTVFGLWRQKNIVAKSYVKSSSNIPLINPDVITAISLALAFGVMFGTLQFGNSGYERLIISQVTMIIPFAISIMYPRSEKFQASLFEASKDLGYGPIKTWFKTYFRFMLPVSLASLIISISLSFDDFIITRIVSKETTIGKLMYEGSLQPWVMAMGTIILIITLSSSIIISIKNSKKVKKYKKMKVGS
ncbi:MAG: ABC transporter permease subunit [Mycoplasmatales bacterium]|nr:ABC transporter permease subunit [Mycoplasmatales bacterium]